MTLTVGEIVIVVGGGGVAVWYPSTPTSSPRNRAP